MAGFDSRIDLWRMMAPAAVADLKRAARARAPERAAPTAAPQAQARKPARFGLEPTEIELPQVADFLDDQETLATKVVNAGRMSRGELPIITPKPSGVAAEIVRAAALARAGGPPLLTPTGLAAQIIKAGRRRRGEV